MGPPDAGPTACAAGELTRDDGTCQPAGLPPDMPCPPGEMVLGDGTCQKAGVPPSACAAGFVHDGKDGCEPILPADPCPVGQMAVPGETTCREVAPCGSGTWGEIPVEANTQFVDHAYAGGNNDGTQAAPWTSIQEAVDAAEDGAIVAVAEGIYAEDVLIQGKRARLWGRCPGLVTVSGTGAELGAILVVEGAADETEIRGVAVIGAEHGIAISGASGVEIKEVWAHDAAHFGIVAVDDLGPTSVVLMDSLIEQNHDVGVLVAGSDAMIEGTAVRSTSLGAAEDWGTGIHIQSSQPTKTRANVAVRGCLVEGSHESGVFVAGSDATIEASVIRSAQPAAPQGVARGILVRDSSNVTTRTNVTVRGCLVEQSQESGVAVLGADARIEATVIRSTRPDAYGVGSGMQIVQDPQTKARANVTVHACLVEESDQAGVYVWGSDATIEATVVRSTRPGAQEEWGHGISVWNNPDGTERSNVTVRACLVEENHEMGVFVRGSDATIDATVVRSTHPVAQGGFGVGIHIQHDMDEIGDDIDKEVSPANVAIRACVVEKNQTVGVYVAGSDATIKATAVRDTASTSDNAFGDGILVDLSNVTIENSEVTRNVRAGVANFGEHVTIIGGTFTCNAFDLDYETDQTGMSGSFDGSTGWQCSDRDALECTTLGECKAVTSGLEPPPPLPPLDPLGP